MIQGWYAILRDGAARKPLESGAMNGAILENYVVSEIAKTYLSSGKEPHMYYYRDKDAVVCMKPELSAIDRDNYIVPIWMI